MLLLLVADCNRVSTSGGEVTGQVVFARGFVSRGGEGGECLTPKC